MVAAALAVFKTRLDYDESKQQVIAFFWDIWLIVDCESTKGPI